MTTYYEIKVEDCFGDIWTTGKTFPTLEDAKAFLGGDINERKAARRSAEALCGMKFSKENPAAWQIDQITIS